MSRPLIPLLAAALAVGPLAAQNVSGYRYALRMTSSSGEDVTGLVRLAGDRERIDFPPGSRQDNEYFLLMNGGHTVATIHTDRREYETVDDTTFQRLIGAALDAMGNLVTLHLADIKIETQSLGAGDSIAGYATRRFRLLQEYTVSIGAMGINAANQHHVVITDFWVSPDLRLPPNPLLELLATVETALAQRSEDFVHDRYPSGKPSRHGSRRPVLGDAAQDGDHLALVRRGPRGQRRESRRRPLGAHVRGHARRARQLRPGPVRDSRRLHAAREQAELQILLNLVAANHIIFHASRGATVGAY